MKLNLFFSNQAIKTLIASLALAILPASAKAFPAPQWMQGGHAARVTGVACSPDGTMIVSGSEDGTLRIWSTNGTLLRILTNQPAPIMAVSWSPDGTKIASSSYMQGQAGKGMTYLWQAPSGWTAPDVSLLRARTNSYGYVTALAFSGDNTKLASGSYVGSNFVYAVDTGNLLATRPAYNFTSTSTTTNGRVGAVMGVAFSSSGMMASGCEEGSIRVYDSSWSLLWNSTNSADAHTTNVTGVAFSPDGSLMASCSFDQTIKIWSTATWTLQRTLTGSGTSVVSVAFSPDGLNIVSGGMDGVVKLWDLSGACLQTITAHSLPVTATVFSPNGSCIISGSDDNTVRIWSVTDGSPICALGGLNFCVGPMALSPDGLLCASAGEGQGIQVRNANNGTLVRTLYGNTNFVSSLAFSPDSTTLASGGGVMDPAIKLWRISDGELVRTIDATTNGVIALAWSPDGATIACGGDSVEQAITLWNVADGNSLGTLAGHTNGVTALAFSPDGSFLASGGRRFDNAVKVWALPSGPVLYSFSGSSNNIESLAFSPDGSLLASGASGSTSSLRVWQLSDSTYRAFGNGTNPVSTIAFSPDGATLAASDREYIKFWNVATATVSETVTQNAYRVTSLAFSPNGNLFAYGREDATVLVSTNTYGVRGQPALNFTSVVPGSEEEETGTSFIATAQPWTRYIIQSSTNLNAGWSYLMQVSSGPGTVIAPMLPIPLTNRTDVFLRAITPP
jgi:WD40 repeat protein